MTTEYSRANIEGEHYQVHAITLGLQPALYCISIFAHFSEAKIFVYGRPQLPLVLWISDLLFPWNSDLSILGYTMVTHCVPY